jgi:MFS family permease
MDDEFAVPPADTSDPETPIADSGPQQPAARSSFDIWRDSQSSDDFCAKFTPESFAADSNKSDTFISCLPSAIYFYLSLLLTFILLCVAASKKSNGVLQIFEPTIAHSIGYTFLSLAVFLTIFFAVFAKFTINFIQYGQFMVLGFSTIVTIIALVCHTYGSIGFFIATLIVSGFAWLASLFDATHTQHVLKVARASLRLLRISLVTCVFLALSLAIFFLSSFTTFYALSIGWHWIFQIWNLITFWYLITVVGEIAYQTVVFLHGRYIILRDADPIPFSLLLRRVLVFQVGISSFNGFFISITRPFYALSAFKPRTAEETITGRFIWLGKAIRIILSPFATAAQAICAKLDQFLGFPRQLGAAYSSLLGLTRAEGCARVQECERQYRTGCYFSRCTVDRLLAMCGLGIETTVGVLVWAIAEESLRNDWEGDARIYAKRVAGACGFFLSFAVFHVIRSVVKAVTDTTILIYVESPTRFGSLMSPDDGQRFAQVYAQARREREQEPIAAGSGVLYDGLLADDAEHTR